MLKTFTGFRGVATLVEISGERCVIIAATPKKLAEIYAALFPEAPPFDPARCKKSVMIEANCLPETKPKPVSP